MSSGPSQEKIREDCVYRVFVPLCISATGQWIPGTPDGVLADLSDVSDVMLRRLLETHRIETADPTGGQQIINEPVGNVVKRRPCPCGK